VRLLVNKRLWTYRQLGSVQQRVGITMHAGRTIPLSRRAY